jgi:hypothetical protein
LRRPAIDRPGRTPKAHERIGDCEPAALPAQTPRRLMIRTGVDPWRMHGTVPDNPARGKAQGRIEPQPNVRCGSDANGSQAQKSKPHRPGPTAFSITLFPPRSVTPTKINRGGRSGTNGMWARVGGNVVPPVGGSKPAKGTNPRSAIGRAQEGRTTRPVRPRELGSETGLERRAKERVGE